MASTSSLPAPKRRKQVYGKLVSRSHWNVDSFFDDDETVVSSTAHSAPPPTKDAVRKTSPIKETGSKASRPYAKRPDTFDIPSSDDEGETALRAKVASPLSFRTKNALLDDAHSNTAQLAPWERKKQQATGKSVIRKDRRRSTASPDDQLRRELMTAATSPPPLPLKNHPEPSKDQRATASPDRSLPATHTTSADHISALARLAARRQDHAQPLAKRSVQTTEEQRHVSRKRAKMSPERPNVEEDAAVPDDAPLVPFDDVFELPASSEDESGRLKTMPKTLDASSRAAKRGKLPTPFRASVQKGLSAPARLSELLADTDTTEAASPSSRSRRSTPQRASTPPSRRSGTPETVAKATMAMTPKQVQLWHELLPTNTVNPSPSALPLVDLNISGRQSTSKNMRKPRINMPRRRSRLVDRLKAAAPTLDDTSLDTIQDQDDSNMDEEDVTGQQPSVLFDRPVSLQRKSSQSQGMTTTKTGPKVTYAQSRSYLQENSIEQGFMAELAAETSQYRANKFVPQSQRSTFDLEDSEDDASAGRIRTIHELRASGRTVSGMYDIEELLGEIQNHSASHRSRRRSALIELATKLTDKNFTLRFTGQSLEGDLALECRAAASDEVADSVLLAAIALILVSEPADHVVRGLRDHGVVAWMGRLLHRDQDISKVAKDRKSNMSKSAQSSFIEFGATLQKQSSLWGERLPAAITTRILALKGLDQLVSKLRRLRDRSELLSEEAVAAVLPTPVLPTSAKPVEGDAAIDLGLSISILESLSTSTVSSSWPASVIERLAELLPRIHGPSPLERHTSFLLVRLCTNLTIENSDNCDLLAKGPSVVNHLLKTVIQGFKQFETELEDDKRAKAMDLLVIAIGIMTNLAEQSEVARQRALDDPDTLATLISTFQNGQKHMLDAESVEESVTNVAFGYLGVMLSNLCQSLDARQFIAARLPGKKLTMLVEAMEEFVLHHQKVDMMNFEGEEGAEVWGGYTDKLKLVLARLKEAAADV